MAKVGKIQKHNLGPRIFELLTQDGKSSKEIAAILTAQGFRISPSAVSRLIKDERESCGVEALLDAHEVRGLLKCSLPLVYRMSERGQIPCVRWKCPGEGKKKPRTMVRFKQKDVFQFIEKHYRTT